MVNSKRIEDLYVTHKELMMNAVRAEARKAAMDVVTTTQIRLFLDSRNVDNNERSLVEKLLQTNDIINEIGKIFADEFASAWDNTK